MGRYPLPTTPSMPAMTILINMTDRRRVELYLEHCKASETGGWKQVSEYRGTQQRGSKGWVTITIIPVAPPPLPCTILTPYLPGYDINICAQCSDASVTRLLFLNPTEIRHGKNTKSNFEYTNAYARFQHYPRPADRGLWQVVDSYYSRNKC